MLCTKLFLILVIYDDNFRNIFPLLECYFILSKYIIHHLIASPHHLIASPHVEWRDAEMWKYNNFLWPFFIVHFPYSCKPSQHTSQCRPSLLILLCKSSAGPERRRLEVSRWIKNKIE